MRKPLFVRKLIIPLLTPTHPLTPLIPYTVHWSTVVSKLVGHCYLIKIYDPPWIFIADGYCTDWWWCDGVKAMHIGRRRDCAVCTLSTTYNGAGAVRYCGRGIIIGPSSIQSCQPAKTKKYEDDVSSQLEPHNHLDLNLSALTCSCPPTTGEDAPQGRAVSSEHWMMALWVLLMARISSQHVLALFPPMDWFNNMIMISISSSSSGRYNC